MRIKSCCTIAQLNHCTKIKSWFVLLHYRPIEHTAQDITLCYVLAYWQIIIRGFSLQAIIEWSGIIQQEHIQPNNRMRRSTNT